MRKFLVGSILAVVVTLLSVTPLSAAVVPPDTLTMIGAYAYKNLIEANDLAIIIYYNAYYAGAVPDTIATETLVFRLMDGSTELAAVNPYPYYANGYTHGCAAMYFTAAQAAALGIGWGNSYTMSFEGNPLVTWTTSAPTPSTDGITWDGSTSSVLSVNRLALGNRILAIALLLKQYWGVNLADVKDGLNYYLTASSTSGSGQDYFQAVLPQIRQLCPQIFTVQATSPIYKTTVPPLTTALGTSLPIDPTPSATIFGMSKGVFTTMFTMGAIFFFSLVLVGKKPELTRHILYIDGIIVIYMTRVGSIVPIFVTIIGTVALLIIGYLIFYEKAN